jgi:phage FluMu gp28-like protein
VRCPASSPATTFAGVDLGKKQDFPALALVRKEDQATRLVGLKVFPLGTEYVAVIGYLRVVSEHIRDVHKFLIDQTGVGEPVIEEAKRSIPGVEGIVLTLPAKQEIEAYLKITMQNRRLLIPYEPELTSELNIERFELTKTGQLQFSHPQGTHDDRHWAVALALYASRSSFTGSFVPIKRHD